MLLATRKLFQGVLVTLFCFTIILGAAACEDKGNADSSSETTGTSQESGIDSTAGIWSEDTNATYSEEDPEDASSVEQEPGTMTVGKTADGKNIFTLIRFNIGAVLLADETDEARLFLKVLGEPSPARLRLYPLVGTWDGYFSPLAEIKALLGEDSAVSVDVKSEQDDWISVPLTDYAKTWLSGDLYNNGLAIFGETDGEKYTFASIVGGDDDTVLPYITVSGEPGDRALIYGKYGYTEMPAQGDDDDVNCMSYALRDKNMILADDLRLDKDEMARVYTEAAGTEGIDALADYTAKAVVNYTEAHMSELEISSFRMIEDFNSDIDPKNEYRIALRVGADLIGGNADFSDDHAFDYHFWVQLDDGRWAQKFPTDPSEIIPCTGPDISPGKYPWDSGYERTPKTADYYKSKTIYFAVTKDTNEFTRHRERAESI
ncbi:MAG: DNRLRE domain-containing protein [Clostridiales Family XIII bacterium]|jgi:hypothetical protein|nr:DNRLRE domain-containing protein [Clostridiales Family XIII bacterium]